MESLSMVPPHKRCVRGKLQLFLRLWVGRQKYEQLRPFGNSSAERIRFHLQQLRNCWDQVLSFQKALGLEVIHFAPNEQFELIYVISAFVERELSQPENTIIDIQGRWSAYQRWFGRLDYRLNPYEFAEVCAHCRDIIAGFFNPNPPEPELIPLKRQERARLHGRSGPILRMKDDPDEKLVGFGPI